LLALRGGLVIERGLFRIGSTPEFAEYLLVKRNWNVNYSLRILCKARKALNRFTNNVSYFILYFDDFVSI